MELIELRAAARRHRFAGGLVVFVILLGGLLSVRQSKPEFSARSTALVNPRVELFTEASSASIYRIIFPNVLAFARSEPFLARVRERFPDTRVGAATLTASFAPNSGVLTIGATSPSPQAATAWSRSVALELTNELKDTPYFTMGLLEEAQRAVQGGERLEALRAAGAIVLAGLGFVLTVFSLELLREWTDPTLGLKSRGLAVIGTVPARHRRRPRSGTASDPAAEQWSILASRMGAGAGRLQRVVVTTNGTQEVQHQVVAGFLAGLNTLGIEVEVLRRDAFDRLDQIPSLPGRATVVEGPGTFATRLITRLMGDDGHALVAFRMDPSTFAEDVASIEELMNINPGRVAVVVAPSRHARLLQRTLSPNPPKARLHGRRRTKVPATEMAE